MDDDKKSLGCNVSGRDWKSQQTKRHSSMKPKSLRKGWEKQMQDRKHKAMVKEVEKEMKQEKERIKEQQKKEAEARRLRKEENQKRGEVVQMVSASKVKRMKKKQLRQLQKR